MVNIYQRADTKKLISFRGVSYR